MTIYHAKAELLKLMAHPIRLQILDLVRCSTECVCHLSAVLDKPQPYVSQQLAILREAGLIIDRKEGTNVFYGLADAEAVALLEAMFPSQLPGESRGHGRVVGCNCPKCADAMSRQG